MEASTYEFFWRNIDWRTVDRIEGDHGRAVTVHFKTGSLRSFGGVPLVLDHYAGEDTYRRATHQLAFARRHGTSTKEAS